MKTRYFEQNEAHHWLNDGHVYEAILKCAKDTNDEKVLRSYWAGVDAVLEYARWLVEVGYITENEKANNLKSYASTYEQPK
jgi:hypothetical protein